MVEKSAPAPIRAPAALGHAIAEWNFLESALDELICRLAGITSKDGPVRLIMMTGTDAYWRLNKLSALFHHRRDYASRKDDVAKRFDKLVRKARDLQDVRNRIVHSTWIFMDDDQYPPISFHSTTKGGELRQQDPTQWSSEALMKLAREVSVLRHDLQTIVGPVGVVP